MTKNIPETYLSWIFSLGFWFPKFNYSIPVNTIILTLHCSTYKSILIQALWKTPGIRTFIAVFNMTLKW